MSKRATKTTTRTAEQIAVRQSAVAMPEPEGESEGSATGISATMRDYLVGIYRLAEWVNTGPGGLDAATFVSTSALADRLFVSPPAVNRMVTRLRDLRLLDHEPYQGVRLTDEGRREALRGLRLHRIAEVFLVNVMQFKWHEVHEEAANISRQLSPMLAARMLAMAGHPAICPHGEPIPNEAGEIMPPDDVLLTHAPQHHLLTVSRVRTRESDRLEYLAALGLVPGAPLEVIHAAPFNGPLQLRFVGNKEFRIVGHNLAEMIRVYAGDEASKGDGGGTAHDPA